MASCSSLLHDGKYIGCRLASFELEALLKEVCKTLHLGSNPSDEARW